MLSVFLFLDATRILAHCKLIGKQSIQSSGTSFGASTGAIQVSVPEPTRWASINPDEVAANFACDTLDLTCTESTVTL